MRVAVVGAGLAGLAAADELARGGAEVVVVEARDRVGGRVASRELRNGAIVELGAEFVLPGADVLLGLVSRFGLGLWSKGMRYGVREPRGGIGTDEQAIAEALRQVGAALDDPDAPGRSALDLLDALGLDPGAREAIQARLEVSCATTADRVRAGVLRGLAAHADDLCPSVAGGNQRLADALCRELGDVVRLRAPVERIAWNRHGARLTAPGGEVTADRVVLAVPAITIRRIVFEPALPASLRAAYDAVEVGHAAKLFVPLRAPAPPSAVLSVPERYWTWTATGGDDVVQPVVSAFAGSAPALAALGVGTGAQAWVASVARLRPDLDLEPGGALLSTWAEDPWVGGAYSTSVPPVAAWRPAGPFHVCGEHTAGDVSALMEGALRSGVRAAGEILGAVPRP